MNPKRFRQVEGLYQAARKDRAALEKADPELRREVESLLAQDPARQGMLDRPAADLLDDSTVTTVSAGAQLGPYKIEVRIGGGGMGEVYRAIDTRLGRAVAIKTMQQKFSDRFEREARTISSLNHPNICTLYDVGPNYLVMELVEGETLAAKLKRGKLSIENTLLYGGQIAAALAEAHSKGITHRDLKPSNIMVTKSGIKVLDFGLAKTPRDESLTASHAIMGTPAYMAPEQLEGKDCDARTDIYALGLMLREMTIGRRDGTTTGLPQHHVHVIDRCLAKEPEDRWQTARDLKAELEWAPPDAERVISAQRYSRAPWAVAAALAVGVLGLSLVAWRATRPVDRALMRFSADLGPEAVEGPNATAAISPDGMRLAFVARGPRGKLQLVTRRLDQATATLLAGTENAADPFFSHDGQWIGFFADGKMKKISVQGGAAITLCEAIFARGASWGEDGSIIATLTSNPGGGLSRVPEAGGTPQAITKPEENGEIIHRWPQILPGGQAVLFTGHVRVADFDNASIEVLSLKTGQWKAVQRGGYFGRYLPSGHLVFVHQGTLFAVAFDLNRLEARGTPAPVLDDVAGNAVGAARFDAAQNGTFVYLSGRSSTAGYPVAWMDSTGKTQPLLAAPGLYFSPRFSPDGAQLALTGNPLGGRDIHVYDWGRDKLTRLTFTQTNFSPVWTPDGKHIVFESRSPGAGSLRWVRADGVGEAQVLLESKGDLRGYSFSPDGQRFAYAELGTDRSFDLWTLPLDLSDPEHPKPGKPEIFLRTPFDERDPAFSPEGRWVAYTSNESGKDEVYVRPFAAGTGPASGKWQISTGGGRYPIWSRNGGELYYESSDDHIMVAAYTARADSFTADKPRLWSSTPILDEGHLFQWNLDLAPDGKRFAVFPRPEATGEQKGSVHVTFLLNFFDELRRRVPVSK